MQDRLLKLGDYNACSSQISKSPQSWLEAKIGAHHNNGKIRQGGFSPEYLIGPADPGFQGAILADPCFYTGIGLIKPLIIHRGCQGFDSDLGFFQIPDDFIGSHHDHGLFWPKGQGCHPVAISININQETIHGDRVGTGYKHITGELAP